jgi:hypothetical protein
VTPEDGGRPQDPSETEAHVELDEWRPPGSLDDEVSPAWDCDPAPSPPDDEPASPADGASGLTEDVAPVVIAPRRQPPAPSRIPELAPADLLRRAALGGPAPGLGLPAGDDPGLWDDPASIKELRMLRSLGAIATLTGAFVVPFLAAGGLDRWPGALTVFYLLGAPFLLCLMGLYVYGVMATLRRRSYVCLTLGLMLTSFVYAAWATILLARIRSAARRRATQGVVCDP